MKMFLIAFIAYFLFPSSVFAQTPVEWETLLPGRCVVDGTATLQGFECIFINITRILVPLAGILLFIMLIVGSFQLMTAGSDPKQAQKAKATLTYAIIGLVVFLGIWFILLLIKAVTGIDVTKFAIPG